MPPNVCCALLDLSGSFPSSSKFNGAEDFWCAIVNPHTGRQTPLNETPCNSTILSVRKNGLARLTHEDNTADHFHNVYASEI